MQKINVSVCLMGLLAAGSMAALAVPAPANVTSPPTNAVAWEIKPETLPDWGAPPDSPLSAPSDNSTTEIKLDEEARDKDVKIAVMSKKGPEWAGRMLQKTIAIYEDFTLEWQIRWEHKLARAMCNYQLDFDLGNVGLTDNWAGEAGCIGGQIVGSAFTDGGAEHHELLQGQALFRIERTNGVIKIYRDGRLLISKEARGTIPAIQLKDEVYGDTPRAQIKTERLCLLLPSAGKAPATSAAIKTALLQVRKLSVTNRTDTFPRIVPLIYSDAANFEAQIDLLGYDLRRCPQAEIKVQCESNLISLVSQTSNFFRKAEADLRQLEYQAGMILQGSCGLDAETVIKAAGQWPATYASGKAEITAALTAAREKLKPFARKPEDWQKERKFGMDHRAWITNSFALRHENHYGLVPPGYDEAMQYMGEMGCNCVCEGPLFRGQEPTDDQIRHKYEEPAKYGIRVAPMFGYALRKHMAPSTGIKGYPSGWVDWASAQEIEKMKEWIAYVIEKSRAYPAFAGIFFDEINYAGGWSEENIKQFRLYLKNKYSPEKLAELGITNVETALPPKPEDRDKERVLFMEHQEWVAHAFETAYKALDDYAKSLKPDCLLLPTLSPGPSFHNAPYTASLARMSQLGDSISIDPYLNGVIDEAYMCDLVRNTSTKPLWLIVGTHYGGTTETLRRDYAISLAHADGLYVFDWPFIYQTPPLAESWRPSCKKGGWEATWEVFAKARKLEPYLLHTVADTRTAMLHSERTATLTSYSHDSFHGLGGSFHREQIGIYSVLAQSHIPAAPLFAETLTPARLQSYRVLILGAAQTFTDAELKVVRDWTAAGGFLIVTGGSTLKDQWGRSVNDYRLADLMGVKWVKSGLGMTNWTATAEGRMIGDRHVSYRGSFAWDEVTPLAAKVLAEWSNGKPAVTINQFGQGRCCFISAQRLGSCYQGVHGSRRHCPYVKDYDAGVREFWADLVTWALGVQGETAPVEVKNCPQATEVTARVQPGTGRHILHFLNYDEAAPIKGIEVNWRLPAKPMKVFYATDDETISAAATNGLLRFVMRDLDAHETVVAEPLSAR
ncbi:MAG: beta-galactosidase trimerization domain-containing protein [Kiritimatiellae bacterium]|nr:beta-galactosidase trimerization domain-containing protein [Kiritimatiellia bacterium]